MASELEKSSGQKQESLSKEYERLGRVFYSKSQAKTFAGAHRILEHVPMFKKSTNNDNLTNEQIQQLTNIANAMHWNGNFWKVKDLKNVSQWLAQFRTGQNK